MGARRMLSLLSFTMLAVLASLLTPTGAQASDSTATFASAVQTAPRTWDAQSGQTLAAWECGTGFICFFTGFDGTGSRCLWDVADPDWTSGTYTCSWATTSNVRSVRNMGTSHDGSTGVAYYTSANYINRIGCTRNGQLGNLAGTYKLRSHRWITTTCG